MTQAVLQKEYRKLAVRKQRIEKAMNALTLRLRQEQGGYHLLRLGELGLTGGPKELSAKLDFYLYN